MLPSSVHLYRLGTLCPLQVGLAPGQQLLPGSSQCLPHSPVRGAQGKSTQLPAVFQVIHGSYGRAQPGAKQAALPGCVEQMPECTGWYDIRCKPTEFYTVGAWRRISDLEQLGRVPRGGARSRKGEDLWAGMLDQARRWVDVQKDLLVGTENHWEEGTQGLGGYHPPIDVPHTGQTDQKTRPGNQGSNPETASTSPLPQTLP